MNKAQAKIGMDMLNGTQSSCGSIVSHQHVENIKGSGVGNGSVILPSDFDVALNGERKKRVCLSGKILVPSLDRSCTVSNRRRMPLSSHHDLRSARSVL